MISYYNIRDGIALLRRVEDSIGIEYQVLTRHGEWKDGTGVAVSTIISCDDIDWEPITDAEAQKLRKCLANQ